MQKDELLYPLKKLALEPARLQDYDYTWDKTCCMVGADGLELPDKEDEARRERSLFSSRTVFNGN